MLLSMDPFIWLLRVVLSGKKFTKAAKTVCTCMCMSRLYSLLLFMTCKIKTISLLLLVIFYTKIIIRSLNRTLTDTWHLMVDRMNNTTFNINDANINENHNCMVHFNQRRIVTTSNQYYVWGPDEFTYFIYLITSCQSSLKRYQSSGIKHYMKHRKVLRYR